MAKRKLNKRGKILIAILIGIFIIVMISLLNKKSNNGGTSNNSTKSEVSLNTVVIEDVDKKRIAQLQDMEERDRMEYYFDIFLTYIESGEYEKAYNLLYDDFKQNYFPTLEDFIIYAKKTFPEMADIEHENIERNGNIYVLWITITDSLNGKPGEEKKMNILIEETTYNDFKVSFSVI